MKKSQTRMVRKHIQLGQTVDCRIHILTPLPEGDAGEKELFAAWALFISIMLLIAAFFTSYMLQQKKITAVHETVISIFAGMNTS